LYQESVEVRGGLVQHQIWVGVDVGGDLLRRPGDAGLRSPFADALTAASCLMPPASAWVAGPGSTASWPRTSCGSGLRITQRCTVEIRD